MRIPIFLVPFVHVSLNYHEENNMMSHAPIVSIQGQIKGMATKKMDFKLIQKYAVKFHVFIIFRCNKHLYKKI